ncbi:DegT/DnrJ/EryC1/StrS family aminotransferase [Candidatus Chrysopegis kryptomonas]|uniref:dTDP-4-amino-4,6-dideoxygalactose transaminase n=1 Tax=Candidatus Chryseopegocella kryptomonas TaxID=1633643 RepID=A0A0P1MXJ4_9BACT|nr:DegT/DnrJ/EryC1/StrS family aminotransferase [Candidatus Chrysopegis kryptomonas]CUT00788.1 dTDP-4-amino-4,6-dideoxygalactose transaminase [Candidatus Chrysopegis kryptomonas]
MKVPFLDLKAQYSQIKTEIQTIVNDVLESTSFILGKYVQEFEERFAQAHNVKHCVGLSSGTDGNHMALWALGIGPGDEVIIPANTFIATAWGATLCGAKPVFVDCHPESYNIDPEKVEKAITSKTKAIVAVHLYGQPADMDMLKEIANKYGLYLVEDAAQAHLAEYKGQKVGGLGVCASFSFYPGKNLGAYGEAGAVTTNDDELAEKFRMIRDHGSVKKYTHVLLGHNYRMEAIQGAVLMVKLKYLEKWTQERRRVASKYKELLSDLEAIKLPQEMPYAKHVYHLFVIQVNSRADKRQEIRDKLQAFLNKNGIGTGLHYPIPLHLQPCFKELGYRKGDFPVAEQLSESGLSLPIYPELTDEQIEYVAEKIREFFKTKC